MLGHQKTWERRKLESLAIKLLDDTLNLGKKDRLAAIARLRKAKQPMRAARALLISNSIASGEGKKGKELPDHSDVEELRVKLIRKHGVLDKPQANLCDSLDRQIAAGTFDRRGFERLAVIVLSMPNALPRGFRYE